MKTQSQTPSALLLLLFLHLLPLPSLSTTSFHFRSQDNFLLTVGPTSPLLSSNPNCTHITAPTSPPNRPLSFSFPLSSPGPHLLRLHLRPSSSDHPVSAFASSLPLLTRFSPSTATVEPTAKEFLFPNLRLPSLPLSLSPASSVSSVELYSLPAGLVPSTGGEGHVLEVVHRVNVGGPRVTPDNDTLWRTWEVDEGYYVGGGRGREARLLGRLNWAEGGATPDTAPETVYGTCREMGIRGNSSLDRFNLTWILPVPNSDHGYILRLHFCDIVSKALYELYFDVYINGYCAYKDLDLSSQSFALASPYYIDFTVNSNPSGSIHISVGPSQRSLPWKINAILNGLEIMKINGVTKFSEPNKKKNHVGILIGSILGCFVFLCLFLGFVLIVLRRRRKEKQKPVSSESRVWSPLELTVTSHGSTRNLSLKLPISDILMATNNFDDNSQIGSGGFGKVYKGMLRDGTPVAVKRCNNDNSSKGYRQGLTEFKSEILILTKIRHRHLVSLIGYCDERSEMILVYEFMKNGPLRDNLYGSTKIKPHLSWKQRLEICIGSARGLHYLHTGTDQGIIIHRDVKSTNILLDENYTAKVADFGLSKSAGPHIEQTHVSTGVKGSFGYLDPEYFRTQQITDKSDVYSFGVVLLEVFCARAVIDRSLSWEEVNLAEWGMKWLKKGHIERIIDPILRNEIDAKSLKKFGEVVEKCLAQYGVDRPTMGCVLWNLECVLQLHESSVTLGTEGNWVD